MASKKLQAGIAVAAGAGTFSALHLIQAALNSSALPAGHIIVHAALLGLLTSIVLFFALRQFEITQELQRAEHLDQVIAELNHHIRNALQVILNRTELIPPDRVREIREIREAVTRIDRSLREILPRGDGNSQAGGEVAGASRRKLRWHRSPSRSVDVMASEHETYHDQGNDTADSNSTQ